MRSAVETCAILKASEQNKIDIYDFILKQVKLNEEVDYSSSDLLPEKPLKRVHAICKFDLWI